MLTAQPDYRSMADAAVEEHGQIARAAADIHNGHAEVAFVLFQHGQAGCIGFQNDVGHLIPGLFDAVYNIFGRSRGSRNYVDFALQPYPGHTHRIVNPVLFIHYEFLRKNVQDFPVHRQSYGLGGADHPFAVSFRNDTVFPAHRNNALAVNRTDMVAGDTGIDVTDFVAAHQFRLFHRLFDRLHRFVHINHHAAS